MANTVESPGEKLKVFISFARSDGAALAEDRSRRRAVAASIVAENSGYGRSPRTA